MYIRYGIRKSYRMTERETDPIMVKMNRYLKKIYSRLLNKVDEGNFESYWRLSERVITSSWAFRIFALHRTESTWYRTITLKRIQEVLLKVEEIVYFNIMEYRCQRINIPKDPSNPEKGTRPLTIPRLENRIYLQIVNIMLVTFVNSRISRNQHGHRPGFGVSTAWEQWMKEFKDLRNIVEFDLRKFHDSISYEILEKAMIHFGVPRRWQHKLFRLNNPEIQDIETKEIFRADRGVGQGVATSAILGIIVLDYLKIHENVKFLYTGFADDGQLGSNDDKVDLLAELSTALTKESGVEVNLEKSHVIKKANVWLRDFKYLGLRYDGRTDEITLDTRSGNKSLILMNFRSETGLNHNKEIMSYKDAIRLGYWRTFIGRNFCRLNDEQTLIHQTLGKKMENLIKNLVIDLKSLKGWPLNYDSFKREEAIKLISRELPYDKFEDGTLGGSSLSMKALLTVKRGSLIQVAKIRLYQKPKGNKEYNNVNPTVSTESFRYISKWWRTKEISGKWRWRNLI